MIELPELAIVIGVMVMMLGYIAFLRYLLSHADGRTTSHIRSKHRD